MPMSNPKQLYLRPMIVIGAFSWKAPILNFNMDFPLEVVPSGKITNENYVDFWLNSSILFLISYNTIYRAL